jgi:hypothetical protein
MSEPKQIEIIKLGEFLRNASNGDYGLPLIQRGSVWKNEQILDLWDSLFKGMPIGSFMTCEIEGENYKNLVSSSENSNVQSSPKVGLFDGQQRTLSLLLGWCDDMPKKIWVDLLDDPQQNHKFRLRISSEFQPIGYQRNEPNSKYPLHIRRERQSTLSNDWRTEKLEGSKLAIDLQKLIALIVENKSPDCMVSEEVDGVKENFEKLVDSIKAFLNIEIALIAVPKHLFKIENEITPVVQLFERLGRGGTQLSQADFIYSSIKFQSPEAHELVESLIGDNEATIARLQTPTQLVLCALRLSIAETANEAEKSVLTDNPNPDVNYFHRLIKENPEFLKKNFTKMFSGGESPKLSETYNTLLELISYDAQKFTIGLPLLALTILDEYLLHCLLRWVRVFQSSTDRINQTHMIQFALYWVLCVKDKEKASKVFFEIVKQKPESIFKSVYDVLTIESNQHKVAHEIYSPQYLGEIGNLAYAQIIDSTKPLVGWQRFYKDDSGQHVREFYARFWKGSNGSGHVHPLLLWLQREYIAGDKFKNFTPIVNSDEETPYDYDHICPQSHWNGWTGITGSGRIIDFMAESNDKQYWITGNGIGNIRVIDSSANRRDGDKSQDSKLDENAKCDFLMGMSLYEEENWNKSAAKEGNKKEWNKERVAAFQNAVELRTLSLYQKYFYDLGFNNLVK